VTIEPAVKLLRSQKNRGRVICNSAPCYIIAEIGVNHNGDLATAHKLIDAAKDASADAVKFQTYRTKALVRNGAKQALYQAMTVGEMSQDIMLQRLELSDDAFRELKSHCNAVGIDFISTAFDSESLENVISLEPVCLKWPSGELDNHPFLQQAADSGLPILLSTGMSDARETGAAISLVQRTVVDKLIVLQCVSNYPARIEDQNLRVMPQIAEKYGVPVGFSDHTIGPYAALAARALGMSVLEKHFTLDRNMEGPDHLSSIEPKEFGEMVAILRSVEMGLGDGVKRPVASELEVRSVARKSLVYAKAICKGTRLSLSDFTSKRPGDGLPPHRMSEFLGQKINRDVTADQNVLEDHFE
jgi:sialic acid synthase SpsE